MVPRDSTSPTNSAVSDPEDSLMFESPYTNSDIDDSIEFKSIVSPPRSFATEFDLGESTNLPFDSAPMYDRVREFNNQFCFC